LNRQTLSSLVLFAALAAAIVVAYSYRDQINVTALEVWVKNAGALGPVLYIASYTVATLLFLPGDEKDLIPGVQPGSMKALASWAQESDIMLTF
jgi:uncharacterized membrane protein YdjX (TVP38/TMEM64 family)